MRPDSTLESLTASHKGDWGLLKFEKLKTNLVLKRINVGKNRIPKQMVVVIADGCCCEVVGSAGGVFDSFSA
jgi:hypothetical protein